MLNHRSRSKDRLVNRDYNNSNCKRSNSLVSNQRVSLIDKIRPKCKSLGPGLTGIKNHGNTCYINSIIQCLNNCSQFTENLLKSCSGDLNKNHLSPSLFDLISNLWKAQYNSKLSFQFFLTSSKFMPQFCISQNDAHEYLHFLLNKLNEENFMDLKYIFNGKYLTEIKCNSCKQKSEVESEEISLCLSISNFIEILFIIKDFENFGSEDILVFETSTLMINIKKKIIKLYSFHPYSIVMISINNGLIHIYEDQEELKPIESIYVFEMDYIRSDQFEYITLILQFIDYENPIFQFFTLQISREAAYEELIDKIKEIDIQLENYDDICYYNTKTRELFKFISMDMPLYDVNVDNSIFVQNSRNHLVLIIRPDKRYKRMMSFTKNIKPKEHKTDLLHCIDSYINEEIDTSMNWVCDYCKEQTGASIKLSISQLPDILIFHLKRFKQFNESIIKVETTVQFPLKLNLKKYINKKSTKLCDYDLVAVCNHYGNLENGHYTAYCKNILSNSWYLFDDEKVSKINEDQIITSNAYILFYERQDKYIHKSQEYIHQFVCNMNLNSQSHSSAIANVSINHKPPKNRTDISKLLPLDSKYITQRNKTNIKQHTRIDQSCNSLPHQGDYLKAFDSLDSCSKYSDKSALTMATHYKSQNSSFSDLNNLSCSSIQPNFNYQHINEPPSMQINNKYTGEDLIEPKIVSNQLSRCDSRQSRSKSLINIDILPNKFGSIYNTNKYSSASFTSQSPSNGFNNINCDNQNNLTIDLQYSDKDALCYNKNKMFVKVINHLPKKESTV